MFHSQSIWSLTILGPFILAAILIYALLKRRRSSLPEKVRQDQAVADLYNDPDERSSPAGEVRAEEAEVRAPQK